MPNSELCDREVEKTSKHHLVPKQKGGRYSPTVSLCQPCHTTLHHTFTNKELASLYNSMKALKKAERLQKYLDWIKNRAITRLNF
ncbi:MAG: HNH endonuclease [Microscillaceae bacterium]|nr:HNH endonuclease [Microscillaceae bacterium]